MALASTVGMFVLQVQDPLGVRSCGLGVQKGRAGHPAAEKPPDIPVHRGLPTTAEVKRWRRGKVGCRGTHTTAEGIEARRCECYVENTEPQGRPAARPQAYALPTKPATGNLKREARRPQGGPVKVTAVEALGTDATTTRSADSPTGTERLLYA